MGRILLPYSVFRKDSTIIVNYLYKLIEYILSIAEFIT